MALYIGDTLISGEIEGQKLNLPFSLFEFQFTDHILNNASWLRADTFSWQSGEVYVSAYEHLVDDIDGITAETETIAGYTVTFYRATDGHKICLADQESTLADIYTATGVAWYYILDMANQRFKLPRELPFDGQAKGNGMGLGLTDGTNNYGIQEAGISGSSTDAITCQTGGYGKDNGTSNTWSSGQSARNAIVLGVTTDPTKSGIILNRDNTGSQKYLYFYVGETVQDANLINAGEVLDELTGKADVDASNFNVDGKSLLSGLEMPSSTYDDLTLGASGTEYTAPANGWFCINYNMTSNSSYAGLNIDGYAFVINGTTQYNAPFMFPCKKGGKIKLNYANAVVSLFRFYYAQGEV